MAARVRVAAACAACAACAAPVALAPTSPSAAEQQLAWVRDVLAHDGRVPAAAFLAHFEPALLAKLPPEAARTGFARLAGHLRGMTIVSITSADPQHVVLRGAAPEGKFALALTLGATGRIADLDVGPDIAPRPASMGEAIARLRALAPTAHLGVSALDHGVCTPRVQFNEGAELAIASEFKLYVLLALADRVAAGGVRWTDDVPVQPAWRSLPAGPTADAAPGATLSIRTLADRMIAVSDNTAADYLIATVGREQVEAAVRASGHAHPELDVPFLGTRELFWMKSAWTAAEVDAYLARSPAARRTALDALADRHPSATIFDTWTTPRAIDRIEWFASAEDLCHVVAALWQRGQDPRTAAVLDVLAQNPGLPGARDPAWTYIGFKGGSEPGVLTGTWLLGRADGAWFVVTLGVNGPRAVDEGELVGLGAGVIDLLAHAPR